jgi:ElaB/YqjD/DUF883 family membrane-anchored ribosome-binding protein
MTQQTASYPRDHTAAEAEQQTERAETMADAAADRLENAARSAQDLAGKVADQAKMYGEKAQEAVQNVRPYIEKSMKDQPMQTLAVASIIGFVLGALWKK